MDILVEEMKQFPGYMEGFIMETGMNREKNKKENIYNIDLIASRAFSALERVGLSTSQLLDSFWKNSFVQCNSNGYKREIGRTIKPFSVFNSTDLTLPSLPSKSFTIIPSFQTTRGRVLSAIKTT